MLQTLNINHFRNLSQVELVLHPKFNLFYGLNGAGKTNFLEALYYLSCGRSFRTHLLTHILEHQQDEFLLFARVRQKERDVPIGLERKRDGSTNIHLAGEKIASFAELAQLLPVQFFNQDSFALLEAGPGERRKFLDWGVFHVEQKFFATWQRSRRVLEQRNAALKQRGSDAQIALWDQELTPLAESLDLWRKEYLVKLLPVVQYFMKILLPLGVFQIDYYRGWSEEKDLLEILATNLERDRHFKFSQAGPQRAELRFKIADQLAADVLSRGQIKLLVFALRLAQAKLLQEQNGKECLFLIDDLPSELDRNKRELLVQVLQEFGAQTFITSADRESLQAMFQQIAPAEQALFKVDNGKIDCEIS